MFLACSRRRLWGLLAGVVAAVLSCPSAACGHGLAGRADLPVPGWLFAWAAAVVLVVSFVALAVAWPSPRLERAPERALLVFPRWLEPLCGAIGVAVFALVVYSGLAGTQAPLENLAPTFVYALFWVGLALASAVLGDVFRPFRGTARYA